MSRTLRKTLGDVNSPSTLSLIRLFETQSRATICCFCIDFAEARLLPIFERNCPIDKRPRDALVAARDYLDGRVKFPVVKDRILNECRAAARELDADSAVQTAAAAVAAAQTVGQASAVVHTITHCPGLFFYGAAAVAYDTLGTGATDEEYRAAAEDFCAEMTAALRLAAGTDEPDPAKIKWGC